MGIIYAHDSSQQWCNERSHNVMRCPTQHINDLENRLSITIGNLPGKSTWEFHRHSSYRQRCRTPRNSWGRWRAWPAVSSQRTRTRPLLPVEQNLRFSDVVVGVRTDNVCRNRLRGKAKTFDSRFWNHARATVTEPENFAHFRLNRHISSRFDPLL